MKKIISLLFIISISIGCKKDPLDVLPDGRVTNITDLFKDNDQTGAYLNACYSNIQPYGIQYYFYEMLASFTDDAHDDDAPTENLPSQQWYGGALTTTTNPLNNANAGGSYNYFAIGYQGIRHCNVFLANIGTATVLSPTDKARWAAEAKVLRAFYYLELIKKYGGVTIETAPASLTDDFATVKRNTFDECVQLIVKDCQAAVAEPALPWRITLEGDRARFTKAVAYAIMSEATLFNASPLWNPTNDATKWQQAASISKDALTQLTANGYQLASNFSNYFITTPDVSASPADKETILQIKNSGGINLMQYLNGIPSVASFKSGSVPSQELVDAFEMINGQQPILGYSDADHLKPIINPASGYSESNPYINRDPRFYATVYYNNAFYGNINGVPHNMQNYIGGADGISQSNRRFTHSGYYLAKFVDPSLYQAQGGSASWKRFRLAEIYLNYAEAENEANGTAPDAYTAVNTVRARATMPPLTGLSQADLRQRIRNERRVEMAFEEPRFYDTRRWKILNQSDVVSTGMQWTKNTDGTFTGQRIIVDRRVTSADKYLIFPIPATEIAKLPAYTQNPGW